MGEETCLRIWKGAKTMSQVYEEIKLTDREHQVFSYIISLKKSEGEKHPLYIAYRDANFSALDACRDKLLQMPK